MKLLNDISLIHYIWCGNIAWPDNQLLPVIPPFLLLHLPVLPEQTHRTHIRVTKLRQLGHVDLQLTVSIGVVVLGKDTVGVGFVAEHAALVSVGHCGVGVCPVAGREILDDEV